MDFAEQRYRFITLRIGIAMLVLAGLFYVQIGAADVLSLLSDLMPPVAGTVFYELLMALCYTAVFTIPALVFRLITPRDHLEPMRLELRLPRETPLYIFAGVAINSAAAYLNSVMISFFDYSEFAEEQLWQTPAYTSNFEMILLFFSMAVVPGFIEEFLFRGVVLSNLLPYGRTTAIVGSAVLFGLMHQNIQQLFYTTVTGLVLGWIYVRTKSIWPGVLMHLVNNFTSVLLTAFDERLPTATAAVASYWTEGIILLLGILSGVLLFCLERDPARGLRAKGVFEQAPCPDLYTPYPLPLKTRIKRFFNVPMIIFAVLCVLSMLGYALLALIFPLLPGGAA